jgi:hypothetical protein
MALLVTPALVAKINYIIPIHSRISAKKEKAPEKYLRSFSILVPRDRIELPTRGFSVTTSEFPNLLKLL